MLTFFRRIRQNLISEGKTARYLKYAIGEIFLVVVGILIALSINNWNEDRKLEEIRQNYYAQLVQDLDAETKNLTDRIDILQESISSYEAYLTAFQTPDLDVDHLIEEMAKVNLTFQYLSFNTNTIETLESTGDIKLMPPKIRKSLIVLKRSHELLTSASAGNDNVYLSQLQKAGEKGFNTLAMRLQNHPALLKGITESNDPYEMLSIMESALRLKNYSERDRIETFKVMLVDIKTLKEAIRAEQK